MVQAQRNQESVERAVNKGPQRSRCDDPVSDGSDARLNRRPGKPKDAGQNNAGKRRSDGNEALPREKTEEIGHLNIMVSIVEPCG